MRQRKEFSQTELDEIRQLSSSYTASEIGRKTNRANAVIRRVQIKLGVTRIRHALHWSEKDVEILENLVGRRPVKEIAEILERTPDAITAKLKKLGYCQRFSWARDFKLDPPFAAYLAGLIDGEGCVSVTVSRVHNARHPYLMAYASITNTYESLYDELKPNLPDLKLKQKNRPGKNARKTCYVIILREPWLYQILLDISPFVIIKRQQVKLLLEFCELRRKLGGNYYSRRAIEIAIELRRLNGTNWYNSSFKEKTIARLEFLLKDFDNDSIS